MPRFVGERDFNLFHHFNRELIVEVVDVDVILYKIQVDSTPVNLYGESTHKSRYTPVELKALVHYPDNKSIEIDGFGVDQIQNVEFRFVYRLLQEAGVYPEMGDIIGYDEAFFEVDNIKENQLVAGQPQYAASIICSAHMTRRSGINIEEGNI